MTQPSDVAAAKASYEAAMDRSELASIAYEVAYTDFGPTSDAAGDAQTEVREAGHASAQALRVYRAAAEAVHLQALAREKIAETQHRAAIRDHGRGSDPEIAAKAALDQAYAETDAAEAALP